MRIELSLSPDGSLRLHLPTAHQRTLDVPDTVAGLSTIKRILRNAADYREDVGPTRGHIGAFPTQSVIEAWHKQDVKRKRDEAEANAAAKREEERAMYAAKGINFDDLDIAL